MGTIGLRQLGLVAAIAVAGLTMARPVLAQERKVGIVVSLSVNVDENKARELATKLGRVIVEKFAVKVVAGAQAEERLPSKISETCFAEPACIKDVGERLGVDELLFVALVALSADSVQLEITAVDVTTGESANRPMVELDPGKPDKALADHADELMPDAPRRQAPAPRPPPKKPPPPVDVVEELPVTTHGRHMTTAAWVAAGSTAALLATGTTFAIISRMQYSDLQDTCPEDCDKDSLRLKNTLADGFFAASIVGAALTTYLYLKSGDEEPGTSVSVVGRGDQIGVNLGGVF